MKKIFNIAFAAAAMSALAVSCQTENLEPQTPQEEAGMTITINASLSDVTKAAFSDVEGLKWEEGDVVYASGYTSDGTGVDRGAVTATLADSYNASFKYTSFQEGDKIWIMHNVHQSGSPDNIEFNKFYANIEQENPGTIKKDILQLISEPIEISETKTDYDAKMKIVGTIIRFLIYSKTGEYAGESVKSVQLVSSDEFIAGVDNNGTMAYKLQDGTYRLPGDKYGTECQLFFANNSTSMTTTLTNHLTLNGVTEAKQETGIYMAVPPVTVSGYKYVVTTDKAVYTFDASSTSCTFKENTVKNVPLNLESSKASRIEFSDVKGKLRYAGALQSSYTIAATASNAEKVGFSYWYAQIFDENATDWRNRENRIDHDSSTNEEYDGTPFYSNVKFSVVDATSKEPVDWLNVRYREGDTWWDYTATANTASESRSAIVTATFPDVNGYLIESEYATKTITVTQEGISTGDNNESSGDESLTFEFNKLEFLGIANAYTDANYIIPSNATTAYFRITKSEGVDANLSVYKDNQLTDITSDPTTESNNVYCYIFNITENQSTDTVQWKIVVTTENENVLNKTITISFSQAAAE